MRGFAQGLISSLSRSHSRGLSMSEVVVHVQSVSNRAAAVVFTVTPLSILPWTLHVFSMKPVKLDSILQSNCSRACWDFKYLFWTCFAYSEIYICIKFAQWWDTHGQWKSTLMLSIFKCEYVTCLGRRPGRLRYVVVFCVFVVIFTWKRIVGRGVYGSVSNCTYTLECKVWNLIEPTGLQGHEVPGGNRGLPRLERTKYSWAMEAESSELAPDNTCIVFFPLQAF